LGRTFLAGGLFGVVYLNFLLKGRFFKRWHKEKFAPRDGPVQKEKGYAARTLHVPEKVHKKYMY
jgi:hypothetical protein